MITPVELDTKVFKRAMRGYNTRDVQEFMDVITRDYDHLYRENRDLKEQLETINTKLLQYQLMEETIRNSMILAQKTSEDVKASADQQASLIIREAQQQSDQIKAKVMNEIQEQLHNLALLKNQGEYFKCQYKSFLQGMLELAEKQLDLNIVWENSTHRTVPEEMGKKVVPEKTVGNEFGNSLTAATAEKEPAKFI